jgi:hypothetical protein
VRLDATVLGNAAGALATLALSAGCRLQMIEQGAARALVGICQSSSDPRVLGNAAEALANLCAYEAEQKSLVRDGVMWCGGLKVCTYLLLEHH